MFLSVTTSASAPCKSAVARWVKAWARVTNDVPLAISYSTGAATRTYIPDFIVIDNAGVHWVVEGKADGEIRQEAAEDGLSSSGRDRPFGLFASQNAEELPSRQLRGRN